MTHLKTPTAQKKFIRKQLSKATPCEVSKIYKNVEKVTKYYSKLKKAGL
jgi:hypothetical protein